jgi:type 1 glutamine amidotransferase
VIDHAHPAVAHLGDTWSWHDEVYTFRDLRPDATVLLRARPDELPLDDGDGHAAGTRPAIGYPLSWYFTEGEGRVFSTSLGHFPHAWENLEYLHHLGGGLAWLTAPG